MTDRTDVIAMAASRFLNADAIVTLVALGSSDEREQLSHPNHPLRIVTELATRLTPNRTPDLSARRAVVVAFTTWCSETNLSDLRMGRLQHSRRGKPGSNGRCDVGGPCKPEFDHNRRRVETVENMETIASELWPPVLDNLARAPIATLPRILRMIEDWLLGAGKRGPLGGNVPDESAAHAAAVDATLLTDAKDLMQRPPGLSLRSSRLAVKFELDVEMKVDPGLALLASDMFENGDWRQAEEETTAAVDALPLGGPRAKRIRRC